MMIVFAMLAMPGIDTAARTIGTEASVPYVQRGKLRDFRRDADREDGLFIQDHRRNWYYARTIGPCLELRWARSVGIDTRSTNRLDRNAELLVRGDRCALSSLTHSAAPPKKARG